MTTRTFTAIPRQEDDLYVAECPEVGATGGRYRGAALAAGFLGA